MSSYGGGGGGGGTASSSNTQQQDTARQDQIIHRFYIKTVEILTDARLTELGKVDTAGDAGQHEVQEAEAEEQQQRKVDKWFNIPLPDHELFRTDLLAYRDLSVVLAPGTSPPPLLIAFTLDLSDVPPTDAVVYVREDGMRFKVDVTRGGGGGGAAGLASRSSRPTGIVLERWVLRATPAPTSANLPPPPPVSYKNGIAHFKAVYDLIRTLPAYQLTRKLRRTSSGAAAGTLKIGIKLWVADGWEDAIDLGPAWEKMEQGLIGIDVALTNVSSPLSRDFGGAAVASNSTAAETTFSTSFPPVALHNSLFSLTVTTRAAADFFVEDLDAVLSSALTAIDVHEDYFGPGMPAAQRQRHHPYPSSAASTTAAPPPLTPAGLSATRPSPPPAGSTPPTQNPASLSGSLSKYGPLGEGLPFAVPNRPNLPHVASAPGAIDPQRPGATAATGAGSTSRSTSSPIPTTITRRRSSLAMQAYPDQIAVAGVTPSPSGSAYRSSPLAAGIRPSTSIEGRPGGPASFTRPSSMLSQSGRSFTQMYESRPRLQSLLTSGGASQQAVASTSTAAAGSPGSYRAPSSLSPISSSSLQRAALGVRPPLAATGSPTPPILEAREEMSNFQQGAAAPQMIKRYSSSFGQRSRLASGSLGAASPAAHSPGRSSGDPGSLLTDSAITSHYGSLRRTASRNSSGLVGPAASRSGGGGIGGGQGSVITAHDSDDINRFLRTLESLPRPSSIAATGGISPFPPAVPFSPSPSSPSASSPRQAPSDSPSGPSDPSPRSSGQLRKRWTRGQVDDALRKMADSFTAISPAFSPRPTAVEGLPPSNSSRNSPLGSPQSSGQPAPIRPREPGRIVQSLPGPQAEVRPLKSVEETRSVGGANPPRPSSTDRERRRAPVLLRGGFQQFAAPSSARESTSPSSTVSAVGSSPVSRPSHFTREAAAEPSQPRPIVHPARSLRPFASEATMGGPSSSASTMPQSALPSTPSSLDGRLPALGRRLAEGIVPRNSRDPPLSPSQLPPLPPSRPQSVSRHAGRRISDAMSSPFAGPRAEENDDASSIVGDLELSRG